MKKLAMALAILICLFCAAPALAQAPTLINFQGKLTDAALAPVDGAVDIVCSVFDAASGGTLLWSEEYQAVPVNKGIFNVLLGNGLPDTYAAPGPLYAGLAEVFAAHPEAWLQVEILDKTRTPLQWETMSPRQRLVSVAYSLHSQTAQTAATADDVPGKDISPNSVRIPNYGLVIDSDGKWVGDPTGLRGPQGPQGEKGETGLQGQVGPVGPQGQTGLQGIQGATGLKGDQGIQGETGAKGNQGIQGEAGAKGDPGIQGQTGPQGPPGPVGPKGSQGEKGDTGPSGTSLTLGGCYWTGYKLRFALGSSTYQLCGPNEVVSGLNFYEMGAYDEYARVYCCKLQ